MAVDLSKSKVENVYDIRFIFVMLKLDLLGKLQIPIAPRVSKENYRMINRYNEFITKLSEKNITNSN